MPRLRTECYALREHGSFGCIATDRRDQRQLLERLVERDA